MNEEDNAHVWKEHAFFLLLPSCRCRWIEGDALALPLADDSIDAITMGYGLRNVLSISQAMEEMRRVLRPGGLPGMEWNGMTM